MRCLAGSPHLEAPEGVDGQQVSHHRVGELVVHGMSNLHLNAARIAIYSAPNDHFIEGSVLAPVILQPKTTPLGLKMGQDMLREACFERLKLENPLTRLHILQRFQLQLALRSRNES